MLSFDITQSWPLSIELWIASGCTYLYLISLWNYLSFLEILPLKKLSTSIKWMENSFCNRKESVSWRKFKIFVPTWAGSWCFRPLNVGTCCIINGTRFPYYTSLTWSTIWWACGNDNLLVQIKPKNLNLNGFETEKEKNGNWQSECLPLPPTSRRVSKTVLQSGIFCGWEHAHNTQMYAHSHQTTSQIGPSSYRDYCHCCTPAGSRHCMCVRLYSAHQCATAQSSRYWVTHSCQRGGGGSPLDCSLRSAQWAPAGWGQICPRLSPNVPPAWRA